MDKYEYKLRLEEIKTLNKKGRFQESAQIADTIDWKKVRNTSTLGIISDVYKINRRFDDAREILLLANEKSPQNRRIVYALCDLAIKTGQVVEAVEYYKQFVQLSPNDNSKYILLYKIYEAQDISLEERIAVLKEYKKREYNEKWAYELAYLYHQAGMSEKCVEACDELILWFGDGAYVEKALELKMLYQPLTKQQEEKYRQFRQKRDGVVEVRPNDMLNSGEIVSEVVKIPQVTMNASRFNTVNLQNELAKNMQQIMDATEKEEVNDSMDAIKKMVEEIPYLQLPHESEEQKEEKYGHIETDEEIDGSLKINFKEMLAEDSDGQISLYVPKDPMVERQITGQMSIQEVLEEWEKTKRAAEAALQEAEQRRLESAKARALQEAEEIMERLVDVIPQLNAGLSPKELLEQEYMQNMPEKDEKAARLFQNVNDILTREIEKLSKENNSIDQMIEENKPAEESFGQEMENEMSEELSEEIPQELPQVSTDIGDLLVEEPIPEEIEAAKELMPEEPAKQEELPSIQIPEDVIEDEDVTMHLTKAQKEIFSYFVPIQGMEQQLCQVLTGVKRRLGRSTNSTEGNIMIQGGPGSGKTVLATDLIKVIQEETGLIGGKIGKIEAASLNQKDIPELMKKVRGGCLIIEKAGEITRETAVKMSLQMSQDTAGMLVILEDTKEGIRKALGRDEEFARKFTEKVNIPIFSIDELVEFAKSYAQELEYEIDEMGVLALYNRISSIEKLDEATTLFEVKDIVDEAVAKSEKGGFKKAFSVFASKRHGQGDRKVLQEKDFEE